jgi:transcriptional regulator with XRE-family HTH domain
LRQKGGVEYIKALKILRVARKRAGITQLQIAQYTGICRNSVSLVERLISGDNSQSSPSINSLGKYAAAFGFKLNIDFVPIK